MWQAHPDLIQAFQAATAGGSGNLNASNNKSLNAVIMGETVPRGRGGDERAARAAAEARKKAAARGLLVRPHGVPVQALPPLTQLLNIINSGMTPEGEAEESKKEPTNGDATTNGREVKENGSSLVQEPQAPVGLSGSTVDPKKQKVKTKAVS